jgi:DNA-binding GntR family transcriptional regulator
MPIPVYARPVGRSLLRDDVYQRLRDAIVDGTFAPGENLRDGELADWLGVSRTPVREAILRLAESGLIVARPGKSTIVAEVEEDALRNARDVVAAMHGLAARVAVPTLSEDELAAMRSTNSRFASAVEAGDADAAVVADDAFHAVLVDSARNPALCAVLAQYSPVLRRAERLRFLSVDRFAAIDRHAQLVALCAAADVEGAAGLAFETWHGLPLTVG